MIENLNPNLGIVRVPRSRMLKNEVADYAENTIEIVSEYAPESVLINPVFAKLKDKKSDIEALRLSYGIDTERLRVANLKGQMMLKISRFKLEVRMLKRENKELDLHVIENAINTYLRHLDMARNDKVLNQRVAGFIDAVRNNEELAQAIEEFELSVSLLDINEAHQAMNERMAKRVKMLSQRSKVPTADIVKGMFEVIDGLFKTIEVSHLVSPSTATGEDGEALTDYSPLINELSQLSQMYKRSIDIRKANNKRRADKKKEEEGGTEGDVGIEGEEGAEGEESLDNGPEMETPYPTAYMTIVSNRLGDNASEGVYNALKEFEADELDEENNTYQEMEEGMTEG